MDPNTFYKKHIMLTLTAIMIIFMVRYKIAFGSIVLVPKH